jgi:uncharacterized membrane protein YccC
MIGLDWLRARDAGLSALRRAGRSAIVMPATFAFGDKVIGNPEVATLAAFGSLAMLLFTDFGGPVRERVVAHVSLVITGGIFVCLGTLASRTVWLAAAGMFVVGFAVLFAGVVSSVLAGASTSLLLSFILPVTLHGPVSSIPDRLAGWLLAGAVSLVAILVLWPAPVREPLRMPVVRACELLARSLRAEVDCVLAAPGADPQSAATLAADAAAAVKKLRHSFFATPYRPTGLSTAARTLIRLVDELVWLNAILERMPAAANRRATDRAVCDVKLAAAALLEDGAALLDAAAGNPAGVRRDLQRLAEARDAMERTTMSAVSGHGKPEFPAPGAAEYVNALEPSFRAQELTFAVSAIAANIGLTVAARQRTWWQQLLGRQPAGASSALASAQERAGAYAQRHSVWLHNSVRGATALALAVVVANLIDVQHSFWVVLGTLAVLRSSALSTGQNALRGLLGTVVGFVIGGALILAIGTNEEVLWFLLPLALLFAGMAPAVISFAAGQAGFTITLLILYNIIEPAGWKVGLIRIEDVAIGCAVSLAVGLLFWPRGATSALGDALADAYAQTARYLRSAVTYGVADGHGPAPGRPEPGRAAPREDSLRAAPREDSLRAAAAARRLDDAFRGFLAERGTKHLPMADVTVLLTGVVILRLSADAVVDLWAHDGDAPAGDASPARHEVVAAGAQVADWYEALAQALTGSGDVPAELEPDEAADGRLIGAVQRDLSGEDGEGTSAAIKMIWTADHIDVARRLQATIIGPAGVAAGYLRRRRFLGEHAGWLGGRGR